MDNFFTVKKWKTILDLFAIFPILFIVSLLSFYFHAALALGFYPTFDHPDPKLLTFYTFYQPIIIFAGNFWLLSLFIWVPLLVTYFLLNRKKFFWKPLLLSSISFALAFLIIFTEIVNWFAD